MKKYYLHNGAEQQGPFEYNDLKAKDITKETPIWHEGLSEWTTAGNIEELNELFKKTTPPSFSGSATSPPPIEKATTQKTSEVKQATTKKKNKLGLIFQIIGVFGAIMLIATIVNNNLHIGDSGSTNTDTQTYEEKVMTVEEIERSQPTNFLMADGNYNESFWGDKIKVHGIIKNTATVASYKDAIVRITYYSKTKTELGSKEYTIYDVFPAQSEVKFELKIENYKDVHSIGWDVITAIAN